MAAAVRIFTFAGIAAIPRSYGGTDLTFSVVQTIKYPLLGRGLLNCTTAAVATSSADSAPAGTSGLWIQVEPGKRVRFEVTPAGQTLVDASEDSPELIGETQIMFGAGWRVSVKEAA